MLTVKCVAVLLSLAQKYGNLRELSLNAWSWLDVVRSHCNFGIEITEHQFDDQQVAPRAFMRILFKELFCTIFSMHYIE